MMRVLLAICTLLGAGIMYAQSPLPHQMYLMNQGTLNPAYIGINDHANVTLISRGQWIGVDGAPFLNTLIASSTITDHSAIGISLVNDHYGINSDTEIQMSYAYCIPMLGRTLSFGLQGGLANFVQDYSKLDVEVGNDPLVGSGRHSRSAASFGFGMMYKTDLFFLGMGIPRITESVVSYEGGALRTLSPVYNLSGGLFINTARGLLIKPSMLVQYANEKLLVDINGQVQLGGKIWLGAFLRNLRAGGINFIYTEDDIYHFGYSFQLDTGESSLSYGTHELMISIDMRFSDRHKLKGRCF